ncbi:MAG: dihydroneopterin aldolase [Oscillatoriales cyanobacterium RM2_1_1]|nr:dihydroneopterin aldolase [Oscillatoriales cyanobacterium SM2_3_0]NJO46670.1 dihydroneopterin aldolase [Oscillatoriales cyanobacterium RM2_1_1]
MDQIRIQRIRCYGYTGYLPEEQTLGQWFEVNVTLGLDLRIVGATDDIAATIDYRQVIATVQDIVKTRKFALVERLTGEIVNALLQMPRVEQVNVQLTKLAPPIPDFGGQIQIEIIRTSNSNS